MRVKKLITVFILAVVLSQGGCGVAKIIGILGTPTEHEKKVAAEYDLAEHENQKILVLVNQPAWLNTQVNLRYYLTETISNHLVKKVGILPESFISYDKLSEFRSGQSDFSFLTPVEIGAALDADMVLLVVVEDYKLNALVEFGYYEGFLDTRVALFDTKTEKKVWPEYAGSKGIKVGFEIEEKGREIATARLVAASAYCLVRYFYDCPKNRFRIAEDRSGVGWDSWDK